MTNMAQTPLIFKATRAPLDGMSDLVQIVPLPVVPMVGDFICINDIVGGKKGIFRVRQRMISPEMVCLWLLFLED